MGDEDWLGGEEEEEEKEEEEEEEEEEGGDDKDEDGGWRQNGRGAERERRNTRRTKRLECSGVERAILEGGRGLGGVSTLSVLAVVHGDDKWTGLCVRAIVTIVPVAAVLLAAGLRKVAYHHYTV